MRILRTPIVLAAVVAPLGLAACFGDDSGATHDGGGISFDSGTGHFDATTPDSGGPADAGHDVTTEAAPDAPPDVASEPPVEAAVDAPFDAPEDVVPEAAADAPGEAASVEASVDAAVTYPSVVMADLPLSYWRFGEASGTVAVDQMGATNGTYVGGVTLGAPGAIAGDGDTAATFDGATAYVDMGTGFAFGGTAPMSYEAWVNPNEGDAAARRFMSKETDDANGREGFLMAYVAAASPDGGSGMGVLSWERWGSGGTDSTGTFVTVGVYQHVVVTYDGATMSAYLNGALVGSAPSTRVIESLTDAFRVATYSDFLSASDCFGGTIDEVAIYDHALTPARIALHYQVGTGQ
ncbi:MAG TPA: LamG domain-containing protein [Polyangiaceae bacterium]|jgi:hypothetical protein